MEGQGVGQGGARLGVIKEEIHRAVFEQAVERRVVGKIARGHQQQEAKARRLLYGVDSIQPLLRQGLGLDRQPHVALAEREKGGGEVEPEAGVLLAVLRPLQQFPGQLAQILAGDALAQKRRQAQTGGGRGAAVAGGRPVRRRVGRGGERGGEKSGVTHRRYEIHGMEGCALASARKTGPGRKGGAEAPVL